MATSTTYGGAPLPDLGPATGELEALRRSRGGWSGHQQQTRRTALAGALAFACAGLAALALVSSPARGFATSWSDASSSAGAFARGSSSDGPAGPAAYFSRRGDALARAETVVASASAGPGPARVASSGARGSRVAAFPSLGQINAFKIMEDLLAMLPSPEAEHLEALRDGAKVMPNESFQRLLDLAGEILGPDEPSFHDPAFEPKWRRVDPEELTEQERLANQKPADTPEQKAARLDALVQKLGAMTDVDDDTASLILHFRQSDEKDDAVNGRYHESERLDPVELARFVRRVLVALRRFPDWDTLDASAMEIALERVKQKRSDEDFDALGNLFASKAATVVPLSQTDYQSGGDDALAFGDSGASNSGADAANAANLLGSGGAVAGDDGRVVTYADGLAIAGVDAADAAPVVEPNAQWAEQQRQQQQQQQQQQSQQQQQEWQEEQQVWRQEWQQQHVLEQQAEQRAKQQAQQQRLQQQQQEWQQQQQQQQQAQQWQQQQAQQQQQQQQQEWPQQQPQQPQQQPQQPQQQQQQPQQQPAEQQQQEWQQQQVPAQRAEQGQEEQPPPQQQQQQSDEQQQQQQQQQEQKQQQQQLKEQQQAQKEAQQAEAQAQAPPPPEAPLSEAQEEQQAQKEAQRAQKESQQEQKDSQQAQKDSQQAQREAQRERAQEREPREEEPPRASAREEAQRERKTAQRRKKRSQQAHKQSQRAHKEAQRTAAEDDSASAESTAESSSASNAAASASASEASEASLGLAFGSRFARGAAMSGVNRATDHATLPLSEFASAPGIHRVNPVPRVSSSSPSLEPRLGTRIVSHSRGGGDGGDVAWGAGLLSDASASSAIRRSFDPESVGLPRSFDAREAFPECAHLIGSVRDQGKCGSCWAVAAVEVMNDRLCVATKGRESRELSAEYPLACYAEAGKGCDGGDVALAMNEMVTRGVPYGGMLPGSERSCLPYEFEPCDHPCQVPGTAAAACPATCADGSAMTLVKPESGAYTCPAGDWACIANEIMAYGSVAVTFGTVHEDFYAYDGEGVYRVARKDRDEPGLGQHATKLIGWGFARGGDPYWIMMNSWRNWGKDGAGFVGVGEMSMESGIAAMKMK